MNVRFEYENIDSIKELLLPNDWHKTTIESFDRIADIYSQGVQNDKSHAICNQAVNDMVFKIIKERSFSPILEIGIGDGQRLAVFRQRFYDEDCENGNKERNKRAPYFLPEFQDTELSDKIRKIAEDRGFKTEKHDMKQDMPYDDWTFGMILYLSGDFGYIMDSKKGFELRVRALNSAYDKLQHNGILFLDLFSQDTKKQKNDGRIDVYDRIPVIDGEKRQDLRGRFYLKNFRFKELERLFKASKFDTELIHTYCMLRRKGESDDSNYKVGDDIELFFGFKRFDFDKHLCPDSQYGIIVKAIK